LPGNLLPDVHLPVPPTPRIHSRERQLREARRRQPRAAAIGMVYARLPVASNTALAMRRSLNRIV
jgi:hypothetical protein